MYVLYYLRYLNKTFSLIEIKIFWVNPKQIATQMFLGFLLRNNLPKQHTKSIPKSENMKFDFFVSIQVFVLAYFAI